MLNLFIFNLLMLTAAKNSLTIFEEIFQAFAHLVKYLKEKCIDKNSPSNIL